MKSAYDPRHQRRRTAIQELFASSFLKDEEQVKNYLESLSDLAQQVQKDIPKLDEQISKAAPAWPIDKLNKVDLAILRLAVYEILQGETPPKVAIDEAVELAKEFGGESSPSFVNGVLGTILSETEKG